MIQKLIKMNNLSAVLKIGNVNAVKGRKVDVVVEKSKNSSHLLYNGEIIKNVSVGGYVKITKGFEELVGKIEGEYVSADKSLDKKEYAHNRDKISRVLNVSLVGYFEKAKFKQGIKELPLIENECYLLTQDEFNRVHYFIKEINGVPDESLKIGTLASEKGKEISIGINSLFASHIGVFGNTGSGKSYTLAGLYHKLFKKYQNNSGFNENAKFLLIDFNGEYSGDKCITEQKVIYNLSTRKELSSIRIEDKLPISEDVLIDDEIMSILANATEKTQKPFISRALSFYRKVLKSDDPIEYYRNTIKRKIIDTLSMADKEKAFMLSEYLRHIIDYSTEDFFEEFEWHSVYKYFKLRLGQSHQLNEDEIKETVFHGSVDDYEFPSDILSRVIHFLYLQLVFDILNDKAKNDHISPAINKLKSKVSDLHKVFNTEADAKDIFSNSPIVVINLNDVNTEMKKTIPLLISKKIYSEHKLEYKNNGEKYLNIIVDEAHNILSYSSQRESETWKDYRLETFEEIIKEGRKFGVFLTIASQRPSDISSTIISQLHNYFLHRLINNKDIEAVERTVSYLDQVSFESLSILPTGTCILAGLSAQVPIIIEMDKIEDEFEPYNQTIKPTDYWGNDNSKE
jgi:DNA helicase HerA-like ATPase